MLTIEKIKQYYLPKNASRVNNLNAAQNSLAVYNDSVPLYQAIKLVIEEQVLGITGTDLSNTPAATTVTVESSSGTDTILPAATTTLAGVMTSTDKVRLNSLITLSGVAGSSINLGSFTGGIILDNRTIKQALQDLETAIEDGTGLPLGNLTSTSNDITVTGGTNSVFVPTGVSITFNPGNVNLSEFGGDLSLTQLDTTGAVSGDFISFNGTNYVPTTFPEHNDLASLQGGSANQYYHLTSSLYNVISNSATNRLIGRYSAGSGNIQALTLPNSITISGSAVQLVNDTASPGNSYYYGTDGTGTKGWYELTGTGGSLNTASDSADIDFTITGDDITAVLTPTGVISGLYGDVDSTLIVDVDDKGRIVNILESPIEILSTQISDFAEATQDVMAVALVAGSGVSITYSDAGDTITISAAGVGSLFVDSADIDFTYNPGVPSITGALTTTGVSANSYGNNTGSSYPYLTVDSKGRITAASTIPIAITASQVTDFSTAVETLIESQDYTIAGDWVFNNNVSAPTAPVLNHHLVNKEYVDALFTTGINSIAVEVATTTSGTLATSFENGDTVDGVVLATGDYILIKDQASLAENGVYEVQASGAPVRVPEMNAAAEVDGTVVVVKNGTTNAGTLWLTASDVVTLDTDDIEFVQVNTPFTLTAGTGVTLTGVTLDVNTASASRIVVNANDIDLATTAVTPGTYGDVDTSVTFTVDAYGRLTAASEALIDITSSQVSDFTTSVETIIDAHTIDETTINPGTANQLLGTNAGATAPEWKTLSGTANRITVTHGAGSVTLATPQDIHTVATPTFGILTLQGLGGFSQLNMTGASSNDIYMTGGTSSTISMSAIAPTINLVQTSSGSSSSGHLKFEVDDGSATASGDRLGYITFFGRGAATTDILGASIKANAAALFTNTSAPSSLTFATSPSGTVVPVDRIIIQPSGEVELKSGVALRLYETDNTNYVAIVPPTLSANYTLTLPTTDGSTDQVLTTNGSGVLSWQDSSNLVDTFYTADGTLFLARTVTLDNSLTFDGSAIGGPDTFAVYMTDALLEIGAGAGQYVNLAVLDGSSNPAIYLDSSGLSLSSDLVLSLSGQDISIIASNLQLTLGSDATGDIFYRDSGGHFTRLPIGSAGEVLTVTGGLPSWEPAASGSSPAGTNYNLQYYNSGAFGADSNITVTPGAQMKLAVGTSTPAATLHARNHNDAGSSTLLVENSSGNNIHSTLSSGYFQWGDNETLPRMYQTGTVGGSVGYTRGGVTVEGFFDPGATYEIFGVTHTAQSDATDGPFSVVKITGTHSPSSGSGDYVSLKIAPTINQTGTHTGDGYGIQVTPTLTSIGDKYVAFLAAVDDADAYGFAQEGEASINYFDGSLGLGTVSPSTKLDVVGTTSTKHLKGTTGTPTIVLGGSSVVGTGATSSVIGTDLGFQVTVNAGTGTGGIGTVFTITFDEAFDTAPIIVHSPGSQWAAALPQAFPNTITTTTMQVTTTSGLTSSQSYIWRFIAVDR